VGFAAVNTKYHNDPATASDIKTARLRLGDLPEHNFNRGGIFNGKQRKAFTTQSTQNRHYRTVGGPAGWLVGASLRYAEHSGSDGLEVSRPSERRQAVQRVR
jgi:hypothetical protein